jgi:long-chain acyl-CoA synthetase
VGSVPDGPMAEDTFPKLLLRNARRFADRPAMREKDLGIWQVWTWAEMRDEIAAFSMGLSKLGLTRGDKVAIVGDNRPRLYWTMCAAQALGAIPVPVYQDSVAAEMGFVLDHAGVRFAVVENQEQVDKVLEIREAGPNGIGAIQHVIYDDDRGLQKYAVDGLHSFEAVQQLGRKALDEASGSQAWEAEIAKGTPDDVAIILYTSGTTGRPKGVVLTQANVLWAALVANAFDNLTEREEVIAYLPMAWVGDHVFSYAQAYALASASTAPKAPRPWSRTAARSAPPTPSRRRASSRTCSRSRWCAWRMRAAPRRPCSTISWHWRGASAGKSSTASPWASARPHALPARRVPGLCPAEEPLRAEHAGCASPIQPARRSGPTSSASTARSALNLKQLYGQTEAASTSPTSRTGEIDPDTVGKPLEGIEVKIAESGEVLVPLARRVQGILQERAKRPPRPRRPTAGCIPAMPGSSIATRPSQDHRPRQGRRALRDGSLFPPKYIENKLKFFSTIKEAVAFGDGRDYVALPSSTST